MGKILNFAKNYSLGTYKTALYHNDTNRFGSLTSIIISILFLLGISVGIGIYFNEIFIQQELQLAKYESTWLDKDYFSSMYLHEALEIFPDVTIQVAIPDNVNSSDCS